MTDRYKQIIKKIKHLVKNKFGISLKVLVDGDGRISFSMPDDMLDLAGGKVRVLAMVSGMVGASCECHMFSQKTYFEDGSEGEEFVLQMTN